MEDRRQEMIGEIVGLAQQNPLSVISAKTFDGWDEHRIHGALMVLRGHQENGRVLCGDITGQQISVEEEEVAELD